MSWLIGVATLPLVMSHCRMTMRMPRVTVNSWRLIAESSVASTTGATVGSAARSSPL
ncbi:MAG: hypothetical protein ACYTG0_25165 [Planctomycetota bacterium]|jgi:hypothetical protein